MKVITQLIRHFWERGALTPIEVEYLLRHGFCRAKDVQGFEPPVGSPHSHDDDSDRVPVDMPEPLEIVEEALIRRTAGRRRGFEAKRDALTETDLIERLRHEYSGRAVDLASVLSLGRRFDDVETWEQAASELHSVEVERFHHGLVGGLRDETVLIGDLWQASDPEPFHCLCDGDEFRGRAARAFEALLIASGPSALGRHSWILKHDEMQAMINLRVVHSRLLESLKRLYQKDRLLLSHAIAKNNDSAQVWSLVLLYNSYRNPKRGRQPDYGNEYGPVDPPGFAVWKHAWTSALRMDRTTVTKFLVACYQDESMENLQPGIHCGQPLMCPVAWHIPDDD